MFPNVYSVGVSNLGFQTVFKILNKTPGVSCDLLYLPDEEAIPSLEEGQELCSFYLERTPREFDIILFSISFENDLINIVKILKLAGIPPLSSDRDENSPLIMGGGIVPSSNPEPFAPIFDAIYLGEAEEMLPKVIADFEGVSKKAYLEKISKIPCIYVPHLVETENIGGFIIPKVQKVRNRWRDFKKLSNASYIISNYSLFKNAFIVEVSRGCPRKCKFCLSSHVYSPVRFVESKALEALLNEAPTEKVGFLGTSVSDHRGLPELVKKYSGRLTFSFSSLRIDAPDELFQALINSGAKTLTFGIEAATERLRKAIGKPLDDELIFQRIKELSPHFPNLKLYFMVGLPGEKEEDIDAFSSFIKRVGECFEGRISLSISPFVPKPMTPFERVPFEDLSSLKSKIRAIRKAASGIKRVSVNYELPKWSQVQALISRGDRRVGLYFASAIKSIDKGVYLEALEVETLPWDFLRKAESLNL